MDDLDLKNAVAEGVELGQAKFFDSATGAAVDRTKTVSASSWTKCRRAQRYSKDRTDPDPGHVDAWGWAEAGNSFEDWIVSKLSPGLPPHVELQFAGEDQRTLIDPEARLSATPDGLLVNRANSDATVHGVPLPPGLDHGIGVEIKSRAPGAIPPKFEHKKQAELQIELWNRVAGIEVEAILLLYGNRDKYDDLDVFVVKRNPGAWDRAGKIANAVFGAKAASDLPNDGKATGECNFCPYRSRCGLAERRVPSTVSELSPKGQERLYEALKGRAVADAQIALLKRSKVEAEHAIKQVLREEDTKAAVVGDATITLSAVRGRETLDVGALNAAGIDLDKFKKRGEPSVRLTVKGRV